MKIKFKNTKEALDAYKQLLENHLGKAEIIIEDEATESTDPFLVPEQDLTNFSDKAVAFLGALTQFGEEANALVDYVNSMATFTTNSHLVQDEDGWFMHDPGWENEEPPGYVMCSRPITIFYRDGIETAPALDFNWKQSVSCPIIKWKYVD